MAKSFGCDDDAANELVQGMYIRLTKYVDKVDKIMYDENNVNTYYVYVTLRNLFLSGYHKLKKDLPIEIRKVVGYIEFAKPLDKK